MIALDIVGLVRDMGQSWSASPQPGRSGAAREEKSKTAWYSPKSTLARAVRPPAVKEYSFEEAGYLRQGHRAPADRRAYGADLLVTKPF